MDKPASPVYKQIPPKLRTRIGDQCRDALNWAADMEKQYVEKQTGERHKKVIEANDHLWCLTAGMLFKPDPDEDEEKRNLRQNEKKKKKTADQALKGYDENNFVIAENVRQRLLLAEMGRWEELYKTVEGRKIVVEKEEEKNPPGERQQEETKERKWKEVSKKIVKTNVRAVKNVMMDKTVMPKDEATQKQVDGLINSEAPPQEKEDIRKLIVEV